ncbi:MAG: glycoside hydrolase family 5 protein [bacterium]|nr:glycoside hydrolase family 5 protein [bacterium]
MHGDNSGKKRLKIRGVNLGGWLVLERWMTPSLFEGLKAPDETRFCEELGAKAEKKLKKHWETFITEKDIKWIADRGINTVRIPIAHWIFGDVKPYYGGIDYLDNIVEILKNHGIKALLDLHAAPGSQNGYDNGGIEGVCEWHRKKENIERTVDFIEKIAQRYKNYENIWGIQLLNEPRADIPMDILRDFYAKAYFGVRKYMSGENVAVVIHDGFRPLSWGDFMKEPEYSGVVLDTHFYQCFLDEDKKLDIYGHVNRASGGRKKELDKIRQQHETIVGEWSLGLPQKSFEGMNNFSVYSSHRAYAAAQLISYEQCMGWFFWSYKIEKGLYGWNFVESVNRGWLPSDFRDDSYEDNL